MTAPSLLPTGTVTFLFTDLESSTRLWQQSPDLMETALHRHDEIIRSCVAARDGYIFATGGDGFAVAFVSAGDAIAVAVESQRALIAEAWPAGMELRVRMGVHTGVAQERDGNYFGSTLNRVGRLHAVAHGGQVIVSDATATLVKDEIDLRDLGRHRLRDFDESSIFQVLADGLPDKFPALRTLDTTAHNLPSALDEFVGRDEELRDLLELLRASRLVTLTGVGGTGKTRLALEAATHELGRFPDGVWVVELAALTEASATPFVIGEAVGAVQQDGLSMVESLARSLAVRQLLLVLDNCEHLLDEVASLVGVLLARCPELVVLATSREGLAVRGERIVAVPSLQREEAVALFTLRATSAGAEVGERDEPDVIEIVDRLDGLPLAIELAAARARGLSIREIADRLDDRFRLLRGAGRGRLERHQTLWNTVAWSYELLSATEQAVFDRLSVFAGGFTLDAAQGVCGPEIAPFDVEDAVMSMVERSLVVSDSTRSGTRYRLLETLRQFGEAQLPTDALDELRRSHANWFAEFAERAYRGVGTADGIAWNRRQHADLDNMRAAAYGIDPLAARRIVAAQGSLWRLRLEYEYVDWALQVLEHADADEAWFGSLTQGLAAAAIAGRTDARDRVLAALRGREMPTTTTQSGWLAFQFLHAARSGDADRARAAVAALLEVTPSVPNEWDRWTSLGLASIFCIMIGDFDTARQIWEDNDVAVFDRIPATEAQGRFSYGRYLVAVSHAGALEQFERAAELAHEFEWPSLEHVANSEMAAVLATEGRITEARPLLAAAIQTWVRVGDQGQLWTTLHHVVDVLLKDGQRDLAQELWHELRDRTGYIAQTQRAALQAQLGEQREPTLTDDQLLARSRRIAGRLAETEP